MGNKKEKAKRKMNRVPDSRFTLKENQKKEQNVPESINYGNESEEPEETVDTKVEEIQNESKGFLIAVVAIIWGVSVAIVVGCSWHTASFMEAVLEILIFVACVAFYMAVKSGSEAKIREQRDEWVLREKMRLHYLQERKNAYSSYPQEKRWREEEELNKKGISNLTRNIKRIHHKACVVCLVLLAVISLSVLPMAYAGVLKIKETAKQMNVDKPSAADDTLPDEAPSESETEPDVFAENDSSYQENSDDSQENFDVLWDTYFANFENSDISNIEDAKRVARDIINRQWLGSGIELPVLGWEVTEMDIYFWQAYSKSREQEERLANGDPSNIMENLYQTGNGYVETTDNHINQNGVGNERDLGVACLRGLHLLMEYMRRGGSTKAVAGTAWANSACLLRHCADSVYGGTGERSFVLYAFSCTCYEIAYECGYENHEFNQMEQDMRNTLESWQTVHGRR